MPYTLDEFASDIRAALMRDQGPAGVDAVRRLVEKALKDEDLIAKHIPADQVEDRKVIYEDPELEFCICAHNYKGEKNGAPHDHGPTWAVYGQVAGETTMTDWDIVTPADGDAPALVKKAKSYTMRPGDAHAYQVGDVHAPYRDGPTRLLRIEGKDTRKLTRTRIQEAADA